MAGILVIGAGINGIMTAKSLQDAGYEVTILDSKPTCGQRTTFANGCQLSFSHTTPIFISPSFFNKTFSRPFFLSKKDKHWLNLHRKSQKENTAKLHLLTSLAIESDKAFSAIFTKYGNKLENIWHHSGTAYIFAKKHQFEFRKGIFEIQKEQYGIPYKILEGNDIPDCDLALANLSSKFKHAIFTPLDKTLNAIAFTEVMEKEFLNDGGTIHYNTDVLEIEYCENRVKSVKTHDGTFIGYDFYVYAGGASGLHLIEKIYQNLQPITGYSLTFDVAYSNHCPLINIIDFTDKVVYSRHGDMLRVAGFFDIQKPKNPKKRINDLYKTAIETFPILKRQNLIHTWCEERVFSHDEKPICAKILDNLAINTAHGHLGITLSAISSTTKLLKII